MSDRAALLEKRSAKALDQALSVATAPTDADIAGLIAVAERLKESLSPEIPVMATERAIFVQAVRGANRRFGWVRFFGPATVTAAVILLAFLLGRSALPGQAFYPVRQALRAVGLAPFSVEEIDEQIATARDLLEQAETVQSDNPGRARALAFEAVKVLGFVEQVLPEVSSDRADERLPEVRSLLRKAETILVTSEEGRGRAGVTPDSEAESDDHDRDNDDPGENEGERKGEDKSGSDNHEGKATEGRHDDGGEKNKQDREEEREDDGDDDRHGSNRGPGGGSDAREDEDKSDDSTELDEDDAEMQEDDEDKDDKADSDDVHIRNEIRRAEQQVPEKHLPDKGDEAGDDDSHHRGDDSGGEIVF